MCPDPADSNGLSAKASVARDFLRRYLSPSFGTMPKSAIDAEVFDCLVKLRPLDMASPVELEIPSILRISSPRAIALVSHWRATNPSRGKVAGPDIGSEEGLEAFAQDFLCQEYLTPTFGSMPKSEVDLAVFTHLHKLKFVDAEGPVFQVARLLKITPARARGLVLKWQLRAEWPEDELKRLLASALADGCYDVEGNTLWFAIQSPLLREYLLSVLDSARVVADTSFRPTVVKMPFQALAALLETYLTAEEKDEILALVEAKEKVASGEPVDLQGYISTIIGDFVTAKVGSATGKLTKRASDAVLRQVAAFVRTPYETIMSALDK